MSKRRRSSRPPSIPQRRPLDPAAPPKLYELERFSHADLARWNELSQRLDELYAEYYFGLERQRTARRAELLAALRQRPAPPLKLDNWVRIVPYEYCLEPLSPAGSVRRHGGRFNIGRELGEGAFRAFPALYLASNLETAYREYFQLSRDQSLGGLTPEELSLQPTDSYLVALVRGEIASAFDTRDRAALKPFVDIIRTFEMPLRVRQLARSLKLEIGDLVRTVNQLQRVLAASDWRSWPLQFDLPANSQVFGQLVRDAGFEALIYSSTQSNEPCVAVLPENLRDSPSHLEIVGSYPYAAHVVALNAETVGALLQNF